MPQDDHSQNDPDVDAKIDRNIRLLYSELIEEGIPNHFQSLIDLIRDEDRKHGVEADE